MLFFLADAAELIVTNRSKTCLFVLCTLGSRRKGVSVHVFAKNIPYNFYLHNSYQNLFINYN